MKYKKSNDKDIFSDEFYSIIDFYEKLVNESNNINIKNLTANKENISNIFLRFINDDFNFINNISQMPQLTVLDKRRYIRIILRSVVEQVILYKYLVKFKEDDKIKEYFGENIDIDSISSNCDSTDEMIKNVKKITEKRYNKPSVSQMSECINEKCSTYDKFSLYHIYRLLCDYIHDGYYNQLLEMTDKNQSDSKEDITIEETMIISVSNSFYESYKTIIK